MWGAFVCPHVKHTKVRTHTHAKHLLLLLVNLSNTMSQVYSKLGYMHVTSWSLYLFMSTSQPRAVFFTQAERNNTQHLLLRFRYNHCSYSWNLKQRVCAVNHLVLSFQRVHRVFLHFRGRCECALDWPLSKQTNNMLSHRLPCTLPPSAWWQARTNAALINHATVNICQ